MITIYFDGGSRGNPGPSGSGYVIYNALGEIITTGNAGLGHNTNNYAEYTGLLMALQYVQNSQDLKNEDLLIYGDSLLVVNQIQDKWKVKAENLKPLIAKCKEILKGKTFEIKHIPRSQNSVADKLANEAMDTDYQNMGFIN